MTTRRSPATWMVMLLAASCVGEIAGSQPYTQHETGAGDSTAEPGRESAEAAMGAASGGSSASAASGRQSAAHTPAGAASVGWPAFGKTRAFQLRRLTSRQYEASVTSLLGVDTSGMPPIERVSPVGGFEEMGASSASVSAMGVSQFEDASRFLAHAAFADSGPGRERLACQPKGVTDSACITTFVKSFGLKAFRRPLLADEERRYVALTSDIASMTQDVWQGIEAAVSAFLQSPSFLYVTEIAEPDPADDQRYRYSAYEMAARLAYFLTGDTPDAPLLEAAAADELLSADGIAAQVKRLLDADAAHTALRRFFSSLLSLDSLDTLSRPTELFPQFSPTLGQALKQQTLLTIEDLVFARDADYRQLFDQDQTFVNPELAALYGVPAPSGDGFTRVMLPESSHRAGLLGQAGVLAARDHSDGTSPTRRGLFVLTRLLCQDLPLMPPANLQIPQPPTGLLTARQRLDEHTSNAVCAACHRITDPVGLSLEHFDALGVYHDDDRGLPIDDSGELDGMSYHGEIELGALLRDHPALGPCLIQSLYGVAVGHQATDFDRQTFEELARGFDASGARVRGLLASITASDGFRYLPVPASP